jgi:hypothetical protein
VGLIEAENMRVLGKSRDFTFWLQPTADFRTGRWSQDGHMFAFGTQKGDWIDLEFPEFEPGKYRMSLFMTKAADYGIVNVSLNGTPIGEPIDLWSGYGVMPTNKLDLGIVELRGEDDVLRLAVNATNPKAAAPFFQFGIDGVRLSSLPEE